MIRTTIKQVLLYAVLWFNTAAFAEPQFGGWTGSGEIYEDRLNPWFMTIADTAKNQNPRELRSFLNYCIRVDKENFGISESEIRAHIENAFEFWQQEFLRADIPVNSGGYKIYVGRDTPVYRATCTEDTHIRFLFGVFENEEQKKFLDDLGGASSFAGIAVRTSYTLEQGSLVGRGYIYFSPEQGPNALRGEHLIPKHWSSDSQRRFALVLRHELGHVFGIAHTGSENELMGAEFPERMVKATVVQLPDVLNFLSAANSRIDTKNCSATGFKPRIVAFFNAPIDTRCFWFRANQERKFEVWTSAKFDIRRDGYRLAASGQLTGKEFVENQKLIRIWFNEEQRKQLLPDYPAAAGSILYGPMVKRTRKAASFMVDGQLRLVSIDESPEATIVGGVIEDRLVLDILHE